jgi:hypothetical protein
METMKVQKMKRKTMREQAKNKKEAKTFKDYNWSVLYSSGTLKKLYGSELNKYLEHHHTLHTTIWISTLVY